MDIKSIGGIRIVKVDLRFDSHSAKDIEQALTVLIDEDVQTIICDFSETDYISSAGLRVLLLVAKKMKKLGNNLALCSLKPFVKEVFDIAGFTTLFQIYESEAEALKAFDPEEQALRSFE
ncbi:STAS domain-containing protein [bacterium]